MVVGFNHNFRYRNQVYHVQTEDGGLKNPRISTVLYREGSILASKKISYADITRVNQLASVVEELMKDQHKEVLRNLKNGVYDSEIAKFEAMDKKEAPREDVILGKAPLEKVSKKKKKKVGRDEAEPSGDGSVTQSNLDEITLSYLGKEDEVS